MGFVMRLETFCRSLGLASEVGRLREDIRPGLRYARVSTDGQNLPAATQSSA